MCGIVGIYHFDRARRASPEALARMAAAIVHRGPDADGFYSEGPVGLGMRRLSVIDLAGGTQPFYSTDGSKVMVFNGEVYNFADHRPELERRGYRFRSHCDTEVVLRLYEEHGLGFFEHLNGMFGLAVWDAADQSLLLARDRIGIKPLYYYQDGETLLFASEIKAILAHPGVRPELDREALGLYLRFGFTPVPWTLFKGVRKLPAGHYLRVRGGETSLHKYWDLHHGPKRREGRAALAEELYTLLRDAVRYQLVSDVPLGAFLSGGLDSSGIVHLMTTLGVEHIDTYNIGYGADHAMHDESAAAREVARSYGTRHHEIAVGAETAALMPRLIHHLDEPLADSSFLVTYKVAELARQSSTVILSGVGGDEVFGGYRRYLGVRAQRLVDLVPRWLRRSLILPFLERLPADRNHGLWNYVRLLKPFLAAADLAPSQQYGRLTAVLSPELLADGAQSAALGDSVLESTFRACDSDDPLDRIMYFDLKTSLAEQLLMLSDKMTMAVSLEARVPYLDHRLVELAARLPSHLKVSGMRLRDIQKRMFRGRLSEAVLQGRKKGFGAPVGTWLRRDLREMLGNLLAAPRLRDQGLFSAARVQALVDAHQARREDHTDQLLALMAFQLWWDNYMTGSAVPARRVAS